MICISFQQLNNFARCRSVSNYLRIATRIAVWKSLSIFICIFGTIIASSILALRSDSIENWTQYIETGMRRMRNDREKFYESDSTQVDGDDYSRSYFDVFQPIYDEHLRLESDLNRGLVVKEYVPFIYTDNERKNYSVGGLRNLVVGEEGSLFLDTKGNVKHDSSSESVRVLFYGISVFAPSEWIVDGKGVWVAKYRISDPGLYQVHVQSVYRVNRTVHQFRAIQGSPFRLLVRPIGSEHLRESQILDMLPLSQSMQIGSIVYPEALCSDAHWRPGRWVRCHDTPEPCVRTGWIWVPDSCHYRIFRPEEVRKSPRPLWVVFAGSSVQRGSFFSFVDFVLQSKGRNLTKSQFWKCWGWMDLTYDNIRVSYLDFRVVRLFPVTTSPPTVEPEYTSHAIMALKALGLMDGGGPDVFYLELNPGFPGLHDPYIMRHWLGPDWKGRFVVHFQKPCLAQDMCLARNIATMYGRFLPTLDWIAAHPGSGLEYCDETNMALPMMHDNEGNMTTWSSQHYHRQCDEGGMYSCCVVCDMAVQQLLNMYLNSPKPMLAQERRFTADPDGGPLRFCMRCPRDLVPFTIDQTFKDITCFNYLSS